MKNKKYIYFVEGECEEKLICALKQQPSMLQPGKVTIHNVVQQKLSASRLVSIQAGTVVSLVFDTDVAVTRILKENIELLSKKCTGVEIVYLAQVKNLEEELVRCTDVKKVVELTRSESIKDFKRDFCAAANVRGMLDKHSLQVSRLWDTPRPDAYSWAKRNSGRIKV